MLESPRNWLLHAYGKRYARQFNTAIHRSLESSLIDIKTSSWRNNGQGLDNVMIVRAAEPPMRDPKSGKFRNIWVEKVVS